MRPHLSVVIPSYNEEVNIRLGALDKVARFLEKQAYTWEGIIVDDGSTDESARLVREFVTANKGLQLIECEHRGKAATVTTGMLEARGKQVLFMDLDQAVPVEEINTLLPWFGKGYDVVIGSRQTARVGAPLLRLFMARGFMMLRRIVLGMSDVVDTQCGFKAFTHESARDVFGKLKTHSRQQRVHGSRVTPGFDVELLFLAQKMGYNIKEVPVQWFHVDTRRVSPVRDSIEGFLGLLQIRANDMRKRYD